MTERRLYTPELANAILARLTAGEALRAICNGPEMPAEATVRLWATEDHDGFGGRYRAAREASAEHWDEQAERVLLDAPGDREEISRARELASHYRWRASKMNPRRYGDRVEVEHSGSVTIAAALAEARQRRALLDAEPAPVTLTPAAPLVEQEA